MKIAIPKERRPNETRVAASPEVVKKLTGLGFEVTVEKGAGAAASFTDAAFKEAGAAVGGTESSTCKDADVILKVRRPVCSGDKAELKHYKKGAVLISTLDALGEAKDMEAIAKAGVTAFAMELMPRISRAQSMDVLSSQSNLAGYKAVIEAANAYGRAFPMMMTSAGTIAPAKAFIMGVGVAGLQAIATAKRLGAVVTATDVRPATREQVASLGGKFLTVDEEMEKDAETEGGYAKEMPPEYFEKQKQVVAEHIKKQDVVITTALIPGRAAPTLITADMVKTMKPGAVIVDLAAVAGGNCELTQVNKTVKKHGVTILGHENLAMTLAEDASALYAKNLFNFLSPHADKESGTLEFDFDDETVSGTCITKDGKVVHPRLTGEAAKPEKAPEKTEEKPEAEEEKAEADKTGEDK
jgi:NAD(P) transhydrogenase subunit alpha